MNENEESTNQSEINGEVAEGGELENVVGGSRRPLILGTVVSVLVIGAGADGLA